MSNFTDLKRIARLASHTRKVYYTMTSKIITDEGVRRTINLLSLFKCFWDRWNISDPSSERAGHRHSHFGENTTILTGFGLYSYGLENDEDDVDTQAL